MKNDSRAQRVKSEQVHKANKFQKRTGSQSEQVRLQAVADCLAKQANLVPLRVEHLRELAHKQLSAAGRKLPTVGYKPDADYQNWLS